MAKQLTTQNATITTAAVEVKTLTISGKQVTLAVFRQLREEPLIADDGTLNGVPWGIVNYHPDKCQGDRHWHFVWQSGSELLRSRVDKEPIYSEPFRHPGLDRYVTAACLEHLAGRPTGFPEGSPLTKRSDIWESFEVELDDRDAFGTSVVRFWSVSPTARWVKSGVTWEADADPAAARAISLTDGYRECVQGYGVRGGVPAEHIRTARQAAQEELQRVVDDYELSFMGFAGARDEADKAVASELERREQHRLTRLALADLPQLFIAV